MSWLLPLAIACALDDSSFGGGGTEGTPTGGGQAGGDDGGGSGGDDTATENCTTADLVWSTEVDNDAGSTPFYSGDSITFWGYVQNPCAVALSIPLESTCLFDLVTLRPPNGAAAQEAVVPGCSTTTRTLELGAYDIAPQAYGWGPIYVAGAYGYSMQATTPDERVLSGTFTIQ